MNRKRTRIARLLALMLMFALALNGCGVQSTQTAAFAAAPAQTEVPAAAPAQAEVPAAEPGETEAPAAPAAEDQFADWNKDAPALNALIEYVEAVTDENSADYIPPEDRVAVFDMDGTLCAELCPTYLEYYLLAWRILKDPSYTPDAEMLEFGRMLRDHALDKSFPDHMDMLHATHAAKAYAGMTLQEFAAFVNECLLHDCDGFEGMTWATAFYAPMINVVDYLNENDFKVYICSGSDRFICRTFVEGMLDIPPENIIGMDVGYEATGQGDVDGLDYVFKASDEVVRTDRLIIKNLKMNKVLQIVQDIGKQPVLSFGNSSGDVSMHMYTISNNPYRSAAFMLIADDEERDYGNTEKTRKLGKQWEDYGFHVISMRDDFRTIYGDNVVKTGEFHWLEDLAEDRDQSASEDKYTLEQVVVLSRHNLRAPLSSNGSVPQELTPHDWIDWSAPSSELTLKGGVEETGMGQYFRKWLDQEGLIPENTVPAEGEVRFNARDKQRCRATARYFAAGMLPTADVAVEYPGDSNNTEDFMKPTLKFYSDAFAADATAQVAAMGGDTGFDGLADETRHAIRLIMDTVDMPDSEAYKSGKYGDLLTDASGYTMEADKEPDLTGAIKTASQVADALLLQYYEEQDAVKAAFGHDLTEDDWAEIGGFLTSYLEMRHGAPLVALSITHPLIQELESELKNESRKFSFFCAHDCTVLGTLSALGVEDYTLPDSFETKAPIGVKLLFERLRDSEGQAWYRVSLVYRSTEQIRSGEMLTLDNPPMRYDLRFEGVETNADGLISEADLFGLFDRTLAAFDDLSMKYAQEDAEKEAKPETATATAEASALDRIHESGVLRVGTAGDYQPMSYLDPKTKSYVGFDAELAEDLAASLGVEIEYVKTSWPTLMEDTLAGKFDLAICGITITDARREQALMSEGYLENGKTVLCRAEDADRYTSLKAINRPGVRVMENPGGLNEKFARENLPNAELIIHDVNQEIPGLVAAGEADVMITEIMEAGYYVGQDSRLAAPLIHEPFTNGQLGVLMPKGSEDLLGYVNGFLAFEKNSGRLDELAEEYIYQYIDAAPLQNAA